MMPRAKIAVRHLEEIVEFDNEKTKVKGFRILVTQDEVKWAVYAVLHDEKAV